MRTVVAIITTFVVARLGSLLVVLDEFDGLGCEATEAAASEVWYSFTAASMSVSELSSDEFVS